MEIEWEIDAKSRKWKALANESWVGEIGRKLAADACNDFTQIKQSLPPKQEKIEVSEFPQHIMEYLEWCKINNKKISEVIGSARHYNSDYAYWTEKETRNIAVAYSTGNYTVKKEPLYYVPVPYVKETYYTLDYRGDFDVSYGTGDEFTMSEVNKLFPSLVDDVVPVEEEME